MSEPAQREAGPEAPFVGIAHRERPSRLLAAFTLGVGVGAAVMWIVVMIAAALNRGAFG